MSCAQLSEELVAMRTIVYLLIGLSFIALGRVNGVQTLDSLAVLGIVSLGAWFLGSRANNRFESYSEYEYDSSGNVVKTKTMLVHKLDQKRVGP